MITQIYSAAVSGVNAVEVEIEVNESEGLPKVIIVGLPDTAVKESRDRVLAAVKNSGFRSPQGHVTINLAPANLKKEGPIFDLPIALGTAGLRTEISPENLSRFALVGELALNGTIRPVKGILPLALAARDAGRESMIVPKENAREASVVNGIEIYGMETLRDAFDLVMGFSSESPEPSRGAEAFAKHRDYGIDFTDVKGQSHVKRALEVAVAGGHNILMIGPPGTGKSMLAKRIATIMPDMSEDEAIESTKIHSVCGLLDAKDSFLATRPFRSPHHTISDAGLLGGGSNPGPGEVSLAHNGVLFLDELPEFRRSTLEVMRQPLEDHKVTISRASGTMTFPARFMLVAAMNPCPCGYHGDPKRECRCGPNQIAKYRQRISGPLLDRIDLHVEVPLVEYKELAGNDEGNTGEPSSAIRQRVAQAREIQNERFKKTPGVTTNSTMSPKLMREHCQIDQESSQFLEQAMTDLNFSARAHDRILKVARTLADLDASENILTTHVLEAIQYRSLDRSLWA